MWVDLAPGVKDLDFVEAVHGWLGDLQQRGMISSYRVRRRKLGFSPQGMGQFWVSVETEGLAQLDQAFLHAASRSPEADRLHSQVWSKVINFRSALYRDFPDAVRHGASPDGTLA